MQSYAAKWILKTSETRSLTRNTTLGIIEDVSDLVAFVSQSLKEQTQCVLRAGCVDSDIVAKLDSVFNSSVTMPFKGLTTFHQQLQYFRTHFDLIEPRRIVLKETRTLRLCGRNRKIVTKKTETMYIPLLETLQKQLNNATVFHEVIEGHKNLLSNGLVDYCDSEQYSRHPIFSIDSTALQIILYYDELELCNPLGSRRKKNKIGAFYYILGNLRPQMRSRINNIQLLLLVKYNTVIEFGIDEILQPIVEDLKKLESEGVPFVVNGETRIFRGTVTVVSADNPASSALGGFKQSASAFRFCRHCTATHDDIQSKFVEANYCLRSPSEHSHHCDLVESTDLSESDRQHYSVTFGVNRRALLNSLLYFDVASGALIPDIMHDILEGALALEVKLMLKVKIKEFIVNQKLFTLEFIDDQFEMLNLRLFDGDKPSPLVGVSLMDSNSNLHQHAMQMWTLGRFLPFVVGHMIPEGEEHWEKFLRLLEIMGILFARHIPREECGFLESLISDHHSCFRDLYPSATVTLKMHSMVHMPRLILEFGPLINHWTTRFEAKHKYFKHLSNIMGNFNNICYSLALRHQLHQCYLSVSSAFLAEDMEVGPGSTVGCPSSVLWKSTVTLTAASVFRANWVRVNGTKYQTPFALVIGKEEEELKFGSAVHIYVDEKTVYFEFVPMNTNQFCHHHNAYCLEIPPSTSKHLIKYPNMLDHHPYGLYHSTSIPSDNSRLQYIIPRSNLYTFTES